MFGSLWLAKDVACWYSEFFQQVKNKLKKVEKFTNAYIDGVRRTIKTTKTYKVSKSYWNSHSHNKYKGNRILSFAAYTTTKLASKNILKSKGGKQNIRDSGLAGLSDAEISRRAKDKSLSKKKGIGIKKKKKWFYVNI